MQRRGSELTKNGLTHMIKERGGERFPATIIAFEGIDGTGKSTQALKLVEVLNEQGIKTAFLAFPQKDKPIGKLIYEYLYAMGSGERVDPYMMELLLEADRQEAQKDLARLCSDYEVVVIDRYLLSGLAYAAANGVSMIWKRELQRHLLVPELNILLSMDPEEVRDRMKRKLDGYEANLEFQRKVHEAYMDLAQNPRTGYGKVVLINAKGTPEEVHQDVLRVVMAYLQRRVADG